MIDILALVPLGIAFLFSWASFGCIVVALRMRYYPFLFLGIFSLLIGWLVASIQWAPATPTWLSAAALIALGLYKWLNTKEQRSDIRSLSLKYVLLWWLNPAVTKREQTS